MLPILKASKGFNFTLSSGLGDGKAASLLLVEDDLLNVVLFHLNNTTVNKAQIKKAEDYVINNFWHSISTLK